MGDISKTMATGDIKIHDVGGRGNAMVRRFVTKAGLTAINAGEPVMAPTHLGQASSPYYVVALTDNKPIIGTDYFVGVAAAAGTHTSTADGYVDVYLDLPGIIWKAKAKTSTLADTQAEIDSSMMYLVTLDLTGTTYTLDTGSVANTNGLMVVGGDPSTSEIFFVTRDRARFTQ
jgi:hypothetical protein